jgi:hypothetical protein
MYKNQLLAYDQQLWVFAGVNTVVLFCNIWTHACHCDFSVATLPDVLPKSMPGIGKPTTAGLRVTMHPRHCNKGSFSNKKILNVFYSKNFNIMSQQWVFTLIIHHSVLTFQNILVTWCSNSLTFNNCTLCPHCLYLFFYLSENKQRFVPLTS